MMLWLLLCCCCWLCPRLAVGYSTGAPNSLNACRNMTPGHAGFAPQLGIPTVRLILDKYQLKNTESIHVRLEGVGDATFKGFLIQARNITSRVGPLTTPEVGTFMVDGSTTQLINCGFGRNNAITHMSGDNKKSVDAIWRPDPGAKGEVVFRYTVVLDYATFFAALQTDPVQIIDGPPQSDNANADSPDYPDLSNFVDKTTENGGAASGTTSGGSGSSGSSSTSSSSTSSGNGNVSGGNRGDTSSLTGGDSNSGGSGSSGTGNNSGSSSSGGNNNNGGTTTNNNNNNNNNNNFVQQVPAASSLPSELVLVGFGRK